MQRATGLRDSTTGRIYFFGRPFLVIGGGRIASEVFSGIEDPDLRLLAKQRPIGSIDLISDATDVVVDARVSSIFRTLYQL